MDREQRGLWGTSLTATTLGLALGIVGIVVTVVLYVHGLQTEILRQTAHIDQLTDEKSKLRDQINWLTYSAHPDGTKPRPSPPAPPGARPEVSLTQVPGPGGGPASRGDIAGRVIGLPNPQDYKILIYAHTDQWFVQPMVVTPLTDIDSDGTWRNWTHLGLEFAALLVVASYEPQPVLDRLPSKSKEVLAIVVAKAR